MIEKEIKREREKQKKWKEKERKRKKLGVRKKREKERKRQEEKREANFFPGQKKIENRKLYPLRVLGFRNPPPKTTSAPGFRFQEPATAERLGKPNNNNPPKLF